MRLLALVETGTHVAFGAALEVYDAHELTLVPAVLPLLAPGMLSLAGRAFLGFDLWQAATRTGADLLWLFARTRARPCWSALPTARTGVVIAPRRRHRPHVGVAQSGS